MTRLGVKIKSAISIIVGLFVWAGIIYAYGGAIFGVIQFAKFDFSLPSSFGEVFSGMFLAVFIGMAISIFVTGVLTLSTSAHVRNLSNLSLLIALAMLSISSGGLLIFVVPTWIAAIAAVLGIGIPAYVVWQVRTMDDTH